MIETPPETTLSILLERVRCELDTLTAVVGDMQVGLSPFLLGAVKADATATVHHAQNIDLIWQTLGGLSQVLDHVVVKETAAAAIDVDAIVGNLPLAALASRLRGVHPAAVAGGGDCDLF